MTEGEEVLRPELRDEGGSDGSPVPSPEVLRRYEDLVPGATAQILEMVELEGEHRRKLEMQAVEAQLHSHMAEERLRNRGQLASVILGLGAFATASVIAFEGHIAVSAVVALVYIIFLGMAFVIPRVGQQQRLRTRIKELEHALSKTALTYEPRED